VVLQQLPFPVWRSGLLLFLLFRIAPGVLPFSMQFFALRRSHVVEFDFLFSLISLTISTPRSGLSHELACFKSFVLKNNCINIIIRPRRIPSFEEFCAQQQLHQSINHQKQGDHIL
jgi:hypothetical protein